VKNIATCIICVVCSHVTLAATTYSYDAAGHLIEANYGSAGVIVYTYDSAGNLVSRQIQLLTTSPSPPILTAPVNGATGITTNPTVTWNASTGATSYDVYFGTSSTPPMVTNTSGTSYAPATLSASTSYYWHIVARNSGGTTDSGSPWSFTTVPPAAGVGTATSIWNPSVVPQNPLYSAPPVTLGVKFESSVSGSITGIRFYKGAGNNGTHIGLLYGSGGALLAQATFTAETPSGWQQVNFSTPVAIAANTVYVAAYFTTSGFAYDSTYFDNSGVSNPPLQALKDGVDGPNGVYLFGSTPQFPNADGLGENYWVDVVLSTTTSARILTKAGIFRSGFFWLLDVDGNQQWDSPPDLAFAYGGIVGDIPITGDWNGNGHTCAGIYRAKNGLFILDSNCDGVFDAGDAVNKFLQNVGGSLPGDVPVVGDWNGSGTSKIGIVREGFLWLLDLNGDGIYEPGTDLQYVYGGAPGDIPVVGDWTGTGTTKIGVLRAGYLWLLDANGNGTWDGTASGDFAFAFGAPGDVPVVGDWTGDGVTKVGMFRDGFLWVLDSDDPSVTNATGQAPLIVFPFGGVAGDVPIVGKWCYSTPSNSIVCPSGS
jgi:hypothetical protein